MRKVYTSYISDDDDYFRKLFSQLWKTSPKSALFTLCHEHIILFVTDLNPKEAFTSFKIFQKLRKISKLFSWDCTPLHHIWLLTLSLFSENSKKASNFRCEIFAQRSKDTFSIKVSNRFFAQYFIRLNSDFADRKISKNFVTFPWTWFHHGDLGLGSLSLDRNRIKLDNKLGLSHFEKLPLSYKGLNKVRLNLKLQN